VGNGRQKETRRPRPGRRVKTTATFEKPARAASKALRRGSRRGRVRRTPATPPQAPLRKPPPHFPVRGVSASFPGIPYAISCNNLFVLSILPYDRMLQRRLALRRQGGIVGSPFPKPDGLRACSPSPHLFFSRPHAGCRPRFPVPLAPSRGSLNALHGTSSFLFIYRLCEMCIFLLPFAHGRSIRKL
jgi:hypothetical protein